MDFLTFSRLSNLLLLVLCCSIPNIFATFLMKDLAIAAILGGILKPRFVPLPIPIPVPFTINKHTHKRYPVPVYSHSAQVHQVDHQPWPEHGGSHNSLNDLSDLQHLSSSHALAQLESASENIDSWVQQLSLSSNALKTSHSNNIPTIHDDYSQFGDITDFQDDWW